MTMIPVSSEWQQRDDWKTDPELISAIKRYVRLEIDLAGSDRDVCANVIGPEAGGLLARSASVIRSGCCHHGYAWLNPPFSQASEFFEYVIHGRIPTLAIYKTNNLATETWQTIAHGMTAMRILRGRRSYVNPDSGELETSPSFHSALIAFNCDVLQSIPVDDPIVGGVDLVPWR